MSSFVPWSTDLQAKQLEQDLIGGGGQPSPQASVWDLLILGGEPVPGVARVEVTPGSGVDVQKPRGSKRAYVEDEGDPPDELSIEITLTPAEAKLFRDKIVPLIKPRNKSGGREPLEISHPQAEFWGIGVIMVGPIRAPQPAPGGFMKISMRAWEWVDKPAEVKTSGQVKSGDSDTEKTKFPINVPTAATALDAAISGDYSLLEKYE